MAIKGKKKPKRRGQAHRRPPSTRRPTAVSARPQPWYRTPQGRGLSLVAAAFLIGGAAWAVGAARGNAEELSGRQRGLDGYTREVRALVGSVTETVREMSGAPVNVANPEGVAWLEDGTTEWIQKLELAAAQAGALVTPDALSVANRSVTQSMFLYRSSALTYELVPGEEKPGRQQKLLERAGEQRDAASQLLAMGVALIDEERTDAGLGPAAIQAPAALPPILPPAEPAGDEGKKKDGKKKDRSDTGKNEQKDD